MADKKRKNIDVSESAIKQLSIKAIEKGYRNFKRYAEFLLEKEANKK